VLTSLGLEPAEQRFGDQAIGSYVAASPTGATAVLGVWVAGNVTDPFAGVINAAAAGLNTAAALNADLFAEDTRHAVAERRTQRKRSISVADAFTAQAERENCERVVGDRRHGWQRTQQ